MCDENKGGSHLEQLLDVSPHLSQLSQGSADQAAASSIPAHADTSAVTNFHPASKAGEGQITDDFSCNEKHLRKKRVWIDYPFRDFTPCLVQ